MKSINDVKLNYLVQKIKSLFSPKEHTHNYAGSDKPGGSATHALTTDTFTKKPMVIVHLDSDDKTAFEPTYKELGFGTTGTLPIEKGGTGATSYEGLSTELQPFRIYQETYDGADAKDRLSDRTFTIPFNAKVVIIKQMTGVVDTHNGLMSNLWIVTPNGHSETISGSTLNNTIFYRQASINGPKIRLIAQSKNSNITNGEVAMAGMNSSSYKYELTAIG